MLTSATRWGGTVESTFANAVCCVRGADSAVIFTPVDHGRSPAPPGADPNRVPSICTSHTQRMGTATDAATRVCPYEVIETAYEGDLSVVFRCRDESVPRELAVKAVR